jgi:hypothetical protein
VADTLAASFGPSLALRVVLPSSEVPVQVIVDWVPPATSEVAVAVMSVSGVSVNVNFCVSGMFVCGHEEFVLAVTVWPVESRRSRSRWERRSP